MATASLISHAKMLYGLGEGKSLELPGRLTVVEIQRGEGRYDDTQDLSIVVKVEGNGIDRHVKLIGEIDSYGDPQFWNEKTVTPKTKTVTVYE